MQPTIRTTMTDRIDPYWHDLWEPGSQGLWEQHRGPAQGKTEFTRTIRELLDGRRGPTALSLFSQLDAWGSVTADQAAAVSGDNALKNPYSRVPLALFMAGLMDIGVAPRTRQLPKTDRTWLYRRTPGEGLNRLRGVLTAQERAAVLGGQTRFTTTTSHDRHNILALETALRITETHPVTAMLGERHSGASLLDPHGNKYPNRGDAMLVREDGLRIILELQATRSARLQQKMDSWIRFMGDTRLADTGVIVLFVAAPHTQGSGKRAGGAEVKSVMSKALKLEHDRTRSGARMRLGVVEFKEWWPGEHQVAPAFKDMSAWFNYGLVADARWRQVPLAIVGFDGSPEYYDRPVQNLAHSPTWLR